MSDCYLQFATEIQLKSQAELDWFRAILDDEGAHPELGERPKEAQKILRRICVETEDDIEAGYTGNYAIKVDLDENKRFKAASVLFDSIEGDWPEHVGWILQGFLKTHRPKEILSFCWVVYGDDSYDGGFVAVSAKTCRVKNLTSLMDAAAAELQLKVTAGAASAGK